jgi:tRNA pseudouridine55 synthase
MDTEGVSRQGYDFLAGEMLLINKPQGWTSFDVVNKLRNKLRAITGVKGIKVGHAGTLDPMATGLLIVCTGKATRQIESYQNLPKKYTGTFILGATTPSFDAETEIEEHFPTDHIQAVDLESTTKQFLGDILQVPPIFSAIKVDGKPLYKRARKGETVVIEPRSVHIGHFELTRIAIPEIDFEVHCSKGTYIRSLAFDFGKALHSGAYLSSLCRTAIGDYLLDHAWELSELIASLDQDPSGQPTNDSQR